MEEQTETVLDRLPARLSGEIDLDVRAAIEPALLARALEAPPAQPFVVDCTDLMFIDMSGVHMLEHVSSRSGNRVQLVNLSRSCRIVFDALDLCDDFGIEPSVEGLE